MNQVHGVTNRRARWALYWFYFTLGINLTLPILPTKTMLMDGLKCGPATMAFVNSWVNLPWTIKPLYGFLSDSFPIRGYRRWPYLGLGLIWNGGSYLILSYYGTDKGFYFLFAALFIASLSLVIADAIADSLMVDGVKHETPEQLGQLQSGVWIARSLGSLVSAIFAGVAMDRLGLSAPNLMGIASLSAFAGLLAIPFLHEDKEAIWKTCLFVLMFSASPSSGDAIFYFMRTTLGFSLSFLGTLTVAGHGSYIFGSWLYRDYLRDTPFRNLLSYTIWVAFFVGMSGMLLVERWNKYLHIPDHAFVFGDTVFLAVSSQIAFMPIAVLSARLAPKGAEGTIYNSVMSVMNMGGVISEFTGGLLTKALDVREGNFKNLWLLVLICNLTTLLPLPFLGLLPDLRDIVKRTGDISEHDDELVGLTEGDPETVAGGKVITEMSPLF